MPMLQLGAEIIPEPFDLKKKEKENANIIKLLYLNKYLIHRHITRNSNHYQYYFDTQRFFQRVSKLNSESCLKEWLTKLDELVVDSVYRLDLRRPKRSVLRDRMFNPDMTKLLKKLMRETILGSEQRKFFELMMTLVYQKKDFDEDKLSDEEFNNFYQEWYPEEFAKMEAQRAIYEEIKKDVSDKKNTKTEL